MSEQSASSHYGHRQGTAVAAESTQPDGNGVKDDDDFNIETSLWYVVVVCFYFHLRTHAMLVEVTIADICDTQHLLYVV
jgi:hypothetical protein